MEFKKAEYKNIDDILELIEGGKDFLKEKQVPQWIDGYPNRDTITDDIDKGYSYILVDGEEILGTTALIYGVESTYDKIFQGEWLTDLDEYAIIHRIAVKSDEKGRGLGGEIIKFAEKDSIKKEIKSIRIDTHRKNEAMQKMLEKSGFKYCGVIYLEDGAERIAFEKILE